MPTVEQAKLPEAASGYRLLSTKEAQAFLGVSKKKLWEMTHMYSGDKRLPSIKLGGSRKYRLDKLIYYTELLGES